MRDIRNNVHHEDAEDSNSLTDNEKLKLEEEQYQQLQRENDFLRTQLAEASYIPEAYTQLRPIPAIGVT